MAPLSLPQRDQIFLTEAKRTGIHKPILAALYQVLKYPNLPDGDTGLGVIPMGAVTVQQVNTLEAQAYHAANTVRKIVDQLAQRGWQGTELWDPRDNRYTEKLVRAIAAFYAPLAEDDQAMADSERLKPDSLWGAYIQESSSSVDTALREVDGDVLDEKLLAFVQRVPRFYTGLPQQREAALETLRLWRKLDTTSDAEKSLNVTAPIQSDGSHLDSALVQFIERLPANYTRLPHQRQALLSLAQLWRQLDSPELTVEALLKDVSVEPDLSLLDPALITFVQRVSASYRQEPHQRPALVEMVRQWRKLPSPDEVPKILGMTKLGPISSFNASELADLDRRLLAFVVRVPPAYKELEHQRDALITLVQQWRKLSTRSATLVALHNDLKTMNAAQQEAAQGKPLDADKAPPKPTPAPPPARPAKWTPTNIQLYASIIPGGNFTWAEATHGGSRMPPDQATVDAMIRIAKLAQQARDKIGRPFKVTSWYRPPEINRLVGGASASRHMVGDAIDFYVDGLTGNQIYWTLDSWWPGGLGRYTKFPALCHLDARGYRARWRN